MRPTRDGFAVSVASVALVLAAAASGNNLVVLVAAPVWAGALVAFGLGVANLRGLGVRRVVPAELQVGRDAVGRLLVRNGRRRLSARSLGLIDEGTGASATCDTTPPGEVTSVPVRWRFPERGRFELTAVEVWSCWPFGLFRHAVRLELPASVVVGPRPLPAVAPPSSASHGGVEEQAHGRGTGDFVGVRPWREGDPLRAVHALSSARTGRPMVVERAGETEVTVEVVVEAATGSRWERELSRAAGEVNRAFQLGRKVGLSVPGVAAVHLPPRTGSAWRLALLEVLALQPRLPDRGPEEAA